MQRWQLSLILGGTALAAAILAPGIFSTSPVAQPSADRPVGATAATPVDAVPAPAVTHEGTLTARAALDQSVRQPGDRDRHLVIELTADELEQAVRSAVHTTVVVDTSGSMAEEGKIEYARQALHALTGQLQPGDSFSLVEFSSAASVVVPQTPITGPGQFTGAINALSAGGGTHMTPGLTQGYEQLRQTTEGTRRLVLLSDGISSDRHDDLSALAGRWSEKGITASAIGLGIDFDEKSLTAVSGAGGGRYRYVDDPTALPALFAEELDGMSRVAARGVQVEVSFNGTAALTRVYGYEDSTGHHPLDGYSATIGDMVSGQTRKVVASLDVPDRAGITDIAQVTVRFTDPVTDTPRTAHLTVQAALSDDPALVAASRDPRAGRHAARAMAGTILNEGIDLWRAGSTEDARAVLTRGEATLTEMVDHYNITDLDEALTAIRDRTASLDRVSATSREGREAFLGEHLRALGYIE